MNSKKTLVLVAGIKGAIGSTLCAAIRSLKQNPSEISRYLMTESFFKQEDYPVFPSLENTDVTGWDIADYTMSEAIIEHNVLPENKWIHHKTQLDKIDVLRDWKENNKVKVQVEQISSDIKKIKLKYREYNFVFVDLLPPARYFDWKNISLNRIIELSVSDVPPDLIYTLAALQENIPVINFTPNDIICHPEIISMAENKKIPICGNDGKTGQTYFKVVLASAFAARCLYVDGWYSTNILGNSDGKALSDHEKAITKLKHKISVLNDILGYKVGENYNTPSHVVRIDYYPPRGDAKEAWDVIDFKGIFDMPMSLRLNLQARDSILAVPMIIDLVRWMSTIYRIRIGGAIPELTFYFKSAIGNPKIFTFYDQLNLLLKFTQNLAHNQKISNW